MSFNSTKCQIRVKWQGYEKGTSQPTATPVAMHWINRYPIDFGTSYPLYNSVDFGSAYVAEIFSNDSLQAIDLHPVQGRVEILS